MAYLRSCYSTQARFFNDSADTSQIIWYWAAEGAQGFPGRHTFAPLSISGGSPYGGGVVGEQVGSPRPWRDGSIPMAPPSGIIDGQARQFYLGQSTADPGIERTAFGIPINCAGYSGFACSGALPSHYTWQIEQPLGNVIGTCAYSSPGIGIFTPSIPGAFDGALYCSEGVPVGYYGPAINYQILPGPVVSRYLSGFIGTGPVYGFSLVPGVPDAAHDWFLRYLPGP